MLPGLLNSPLILLISLAGIIIAITVHEFAHAYVADRLGDPTPGLMGRLTLNPLAHLDLLGTLMIIFVHFGWGKPVQFDPFNLRNPRRDSAFISLAGPVSNLLLAALCSVVLRIILNFSVLPGSGTMFILMGFGIFLLEAVVRINVILAIFNLIPIHPLDGFKIVEGLLPQEYADQWHELQQYGMIFLILLIVPLFGRSSPVDNLISPVINFILNLLLPAGGIV